MNAIKKYFQLNFEALTSRELNLRDRKIYEMNFEKEIQSSYKLWLNNLKECMRKSCYRRALGMISKMPNEFIDCYDYFEIELLRLRCFRKIIVHKTEKYVQELKENRMKERRSLEFWVNQLYFSMNHLILEIRPDIKENNLKVYLQEDKLNRLENTILFFLDAFYHLILFSGKVNEVPQMCAYYAMCSRLDSFISYCRKPKTLELYVRVSLVKARLFIQNRDYQNALICIEDTMTICFRQCFLLVDFDEGLNDRVFDKGNNRKSEDTIIFTCFIHMVIAFYQRGLCYEFKGNISKSIEAYKQSSWMCNKFLRASYPSLADLFSKLLKRALCYHEVIKDIFDYDSRLKERIRKEKFNKHLIELNESQEKKRQREILQKIANGDQTSHLKRLDKTEEIISKIEIKEIELSNKKENSKSKYITSTLNLIDYLLNDSFRPILKQMNKLELHCLDLDTQRKIEKQIIQSPDSNSINQNQSCSNTNSQISNSSSANFKKKFQMKKYPIQYKVKGMRVSSSSQNNRSTSMCISVKHMTDRVEKIKVDNTFDKDYRLKKSFLEKYNSKEIKFQKNLLKSKKNEVNEKPKGVIAQCIRNNAENFMKQRLLSGKEGDTKRILRNYDSQKDIHFLEKQSQLENQVLKSLSTKSYGEYQKNLWSSRSLNSSKSQSTSLSKNYYDLSTRSNANLDLIKKLDLENERLDWIKSKRKDNTRRKK